MIQDRLPRGNYTTLALSFDAQTVYFAFAERAERKPDFYSPQRRCLHLFAMNADGTKLRQLTDGPDDDFDPCPLPDGDVAFRSTRRGGFGRCHNPWEPLPAYTLHRMDASGQGVRTLSFHETNEWHSFVLNDGRIVYTRWDYVDRSAANFHGLWVSNPDGSNPAILFGNYTLRVNACYQPRSIPGFDRILFVAGAHHADVGGALVMLDPAAWDATSRSGLPHPCNGPRRLNDCRRSSSLDRRVRDRSATRACFNRSWTDTACSVMTAPRAPCRANSCSRGSPRMPSLSRTRT